MGNDKKVGNGKPVQQPQVKGAQTQRTDNSKAKINEELSKINGGKNPADNQGKGTSVQRSTQKITLNSGRYIVIDKDGNQKFYSADGTQLKKDYFIEKLKQYDLTTTDGAGKTIKGKHGEYTVIGKCKDGSTLVMSEDGKYKTIKNNIITDANSIPAKKTDNNPIKNTIKAVATTIKDVAKAVAPLAGAVAAGAVVGAGVGALGGGVGAVPGAIVGGVLTLLACTTTSCSSDLDDDYTPANATTTLTWDNSDICDALNGKFVNNNNSGYTSSDGRLQYTYGFSYNDAGITADIDTEIDDSAFRNYSIIPAEETPAEDITDYLNMKKTDDSYTFDVSNDKTSATVTFDNGLTYTANNTSSKNADLTLGGAQKTLYSMLNSVGLDKRNNDAEITMNLSSSAGSYGNNVPGFSITQDTDSASDIANILNSEKSYVKMSIGGQEVSGQVTLDGGNVKIGSATLSQVEGYEIGTSDYSEKVNGMLVTLPNGDKYIITQDYGQLDIGKVDNENGTTLQWYETSGETFDTSMVDTAVGDYNDYHDDIDNAKDEALEAVTEYLAGIGYKVDAKGTVTVKK